MEVEEQNSRNKKSVLLALALTLLTFIGLVVWGIILSSKQPVSSEQLGDAKNVLEFLKEEPTRNYTESDNESILARLSRADTEYLQEIASLKEENLSLVEDYNSLVDTYNALLEYAEEVEKERDEALEIQQEMMIMLEDLSSLVL